MPPAAPPEPGPPGLAEVVAAPRLLAAAFSGLALGATLVHAGQDLALGEPQRLGLNATAVAALFLAYAATATVALAFLAWRPARAAALLLTGLVPVAVAAGHLGDLGAGLYGAVLWLVLAGGLGALALHGWLLLERAQREEPVVGAAPRPPTVP